MTKEEFVKGIENKQIDVAVSEMCYLDVQIKYRALIPEQIKRILSYAEDTIFFDDGWRLLSVQEIVHADREFHVDFPKLGIIPVFDTGDNDFVVYDLNNNIWSKYNIIDETTFKRKEKLCELI